MWQLMSWSEYRRLAVLEALTDGVMVTVRRLGVSKSTMYRWIAEQRELARERNSTQLCHTTHLPSHLAALTTTTTTTTTSRSSHGSL